MSPARPPKGPDVVSLSDIAGMLDELGIAWTTQERAHDGRLLYRIGAVVLTPGEIAGKYERGELQAMSDDEVALAAALAAKPRTKGPDVVSLTDIARKLGKDKTYAQWVMDRDVHPEAPVGTQTAAGMIWHRPEAWAFLEVWEPQKGPRATCDQGHPMKESPSGRRYCPTCDVRRHKEKRERDRAGSEPVTSGNEENMS